MGLALGDAVLHRQHGIYVGQPIVDAYLLQEDHKWIGGAFHESIMSSPFGEVVTEWRDAVRHDLLLGSGRKTMAALNWPQYAPVSIRTALVSMRDNSPPGVRSKYDETLAFYDLFNEIDGTHMGTLRNMDVRSDDEAD